MQKTEKNEQETTPEKIFEISFSFAPNRVLVAGVDLEVFTHIANGNHTAGEIAKAASASPRGMEMLLNSLTGLSFLSKSNG
ncbi:MAG: methyltransferase type 12, partial [Spirochaetes bacterium]|nr:methyltransferase type 12 [Spirochaetota bacterium]